MKLFKKEKFDLDFEIFKKYGAYGFCKLKNLNYIYDFPKNKIERDGVVALFEQDYFKSEQEKYESFLNTLKELNRLTQLKNDIERITPKEQTDGKTE